MSNNKTHWLQSPNKNYLGHWDLPNGQDLVVTIDSAKWEKVKNPITNKTQSKRVIRFKEDIKPMICNQTNAQAIIRSTGVKFMEDSGGARITLFVGIHKDRITRSDIDCIRVRTDPAIAADEKLQNIIKLFGTKGLQITAEESEGIDRVIENKEVANYDKAIKFLTSKTK